MFEEKSVLMAAMRELDRLISDRDALLAKVNELETRRFDNRPKLGKNEVENIKELRRAGYKIAEIADIYDVNKSTISRTLRGVYH